MTRGSEHRRSFRIIESALLQYKIIDADEFDQGLELWKLRLGAPPGMRSKILDLDSRLDALLYRIKNDAPATSDAFRLLNKKLNIIMEALPEFRETKEALANQPGQTCEISAEGMVFGSNELLEPQTPLLLRFLLTSGNCFFETFCHVVRSRSRYESDTDIGSYSHRVAVEFHWENAADREILIQHLFSKQSETLRLRRKQSEADAVQGESASGMALPCSKK